MTYQEEDRLDYFRTALFLFFFLLFVTASSDKQAGQTGVSSACSIIYVMQEHPSAVTVASTIQWPSADKNWFFLDKTDFRLHDANLRIIVVNKSLSRHCTMLQETRRCIKPRCDRRYYRLMIPGDTDDWPFLS
jgi:hypothetical protein